MPTVTTRHGGSLSSFFVRHSSKWNTSASPQYCNDMVAVSRLGTWNVWLLVGWNAFGQIFVTKNAGTWIPTDQSTKLIFDFHDIMDLTEVSSNMLQRSWWWLIDYQGQKSKSMSHSNGFTWLMRSKETGVDFRKTPAFEEAACCKRKTCTSWEKHTEVGQIINASLTEEFVETAKPQPITLQVTQ